MNTMVCCPPWPRPKLSFPSPKWYPIRRFESMVRINDSLAELVGFVFWRSCAPISDYMAPRLLYLVLRRAWDCQNSPTWFRRVCWPCRPSRVYFLDRVDRPGPFCWPFPPTATPDRICVDLVGRSLLDRVDPFRSVLLSVMAQLSFSRFSFSDLSSIRCYLSELGF